MIRTDSRHRRRTVQTSLLTLVVGAALVVPNLDGRQEPAATLAPAGPARPRLITPGTASAGERLPVLAFSYRGCGPIQLRFDETPAEHRLTRYAASLNPAWTELFTTLTVPSSALRGRHEIQLYGRCETGPVATAEVVIGP